MMRLSNILQTPDGIPKPGNNDPIDLSSWIDVTFYIVIPVLIIIFYLTWRKKRRNKKNE
ncbi:adenylosuccinate synthetase [Galbibacter sp. PAP.153]|uniref:adenylosuccinate synthetase n=1 Tax=Galbibacter sp. PAP.153 TaxID=3104623 RepID=UPI0030084B6E